MRKNTRVLFLFALILLNGSALLAQGRDRGTAGAILGVGARAQGMGGAFTALADDATAASWNPAGLAQLSRPEVSLVYDSFDFDNSIRFEQTTTLSRAVERDEFILNLASGERIKIPEGATTWTETVTRHGEGDYSALGFASATLPFSLGPRALVAQVSYRSFSTFPDTVRNSETKIVFENAFGRRIGNVVDIDDRPLGDEVKEIQRFRGIPGGDIEAYTLSLATSILGNLNIGASLNYMQSNWVDQRFFGTAFGDDDILEFEDTYGFDFSETTYDIGLQYKPTSRIFLGAVYHSGFETSVDTSNYFLPPGFTLVGGPLQLESEVEWPSGFAVGAAFRPADRLTFALDYAVTNWSEAVIQDFAFAGFDCDVPTRTCAAVPLFEEGPGFGQQAPFPAVFATRQHDTASVRLGAEYVFAVDELLLPVRAGYFTEEQMFDALDSFGDTDQADPHNPEYDGFSFGLGFVYRHLQIDFAYVKTSGTELLLPREFTSSGNELDVTVDLDRFEQTASTDRVLVSAIYRF